MDIVIGINDNSGYDNNVIYKGSVYKRAFLMCSKDLIEKKKDLDMKNNYELYESPIIVINFDETGNEVYMEIDMNMISYKQLIDLDTSNEYIKLVHELILFNAKGIEHEKINRIKKY